MSTQTADPAFSQTSLLHRLPVLGQWLQARRKRRMHKTDSLPHRITQKRIYILPTRRGWLFLGSVLLMLIASINYNLNLGFAVSFLLAGLFASTLLATYRNLSNLVISEVSGGEATCGENLPFSIRLDNPGRQARKAIELCNAQYGIFCDIEANSETTAVLKLPAKHRGYQPLERLTLTSDYPLGLWFTWTYFNNNVSGLVYARPESNPPAAPLSSEDSNDKSRHKAADGEIDGLRSYVPGDSPTAIAWKAMARGQGLHTRDTRSDVNLHSHVFSWSATAVLGDSEQRFSRLAAWIKQAHEHGHAFQLTLPGRQLGPGSGEQHYLEARHLIATSGSADADSGN